MLVLRFFFFILCFGATQVYAQYTDFIIRNINQNDGLPQNGASHILLDKNKILWITTEDGLCFFDGVRVQTVSTPLLRTRLSGLMQYDEKTIIIIDENQNACLIKNFKAENKLLQPGTYGFPLKNANRLAKTNNGYSKTISYLLGYGGFMFSDTIALFNIEAGYFSVFTHKGQLRTFAACSKREGDFCQAGNYIFGLDKKSVAIIQYTTAGQVAKIPLHFIDKRKQYNIVPSADTNPEFYITQDAFCYQAKVKPDGKVSIELLCSNFASAAITTQIQAVGKDYFIAGTMNNGLYEYRRNYFKHTVANEAESSARALAVMPDGNTVLANNNNLYSPYGYKGRVSGSRILSNSIFRSQDGLYWYAKQQGAAGNQVYTSAFPGQKNEQLRCQFKGDVQCIIEDKTKTIWIAEDNKIVGIKHIHKDTAGVNLSHLGDYVMATTLLQYNDTTMLVGTRSGLYTFDIRFPASTLALLTLSGKCIDYITLDSVQPEAIWIGTYGSGFFWMKNIKAQPIAFPTDLEKRLSTVHHILWDKKGRVWMPTNNGLMVTSDSALRAYIKDTAQVPNYYCFNNSNGLPVTEFNSPGHQNVARLSNGATALATIKGLIWFNPDHIPVVFSADSIRLLDVEIDGKKMDTQNDIQVPGGANYLKLTLLTSCLGLPKNRHIEYAIYKQKDSSNIRWNAIEASREELLFSHLEAGGYVLLFRISVNFGHDDFLYQRMQIVVHPMWYQQRYFQFMFLFVALGLLVALFVWRQHLARKRIKKLSVIVQSMTGQLRKRNNDLEASNAFRAQLIKVLGHDLSIPIYYINATLNLLSKDQSIPANLAAQLSVLYKEGYHLEQLANDLLTWLNVQNGQQTLSVQLEHFSIADLLAERWKLFSGRAISKHITLIAALENDVIVYSDNHILSIILHNILDNSVKFLKSGNIRVEAGSNNNKWWLVFTEEPSLAIHRSFTNKGIKEQSGRGIGQKLVQDFASILNIDVDVKKNEFGLFTTTLKQL